MGESLGPHCGPRRENESAVLSGPRGSEVANEKGEREMLETLPQRTRESRAGSFRAGAAVHTAPFSEGKSDQGPRGRTDARVLSGYALAI